MPEKWVIDSWTLLQVTTAVHVPRCDTFYLNFSTMGGWSSASSIFIYVKIWTNFPASAQKCIQIKVGTTCEQCWWRKQSVVNVLLEAKQSTVVLLSQMPKSIGRETVHEQNLKSMKYGKGHGFGPKPDHPPGPEAGVTPVPVRACMSACSTPVELFTRSDDESSLGASPMFY